MQDLKQQKFTINAEPSDTVCAPTKQMSRQKLILPQILDVKQKIAGEKGWEVPTQKLIYSGEF